MLAARSRDRLQSLAEELGGPERALAVRCDVSDWADQQRMAADALATFGRIDVAFANAGVVETAVMASAATTVQSVLLRMSTPCRRRRTMQRRVAVISDARSGGQ